MVVFTNIKIENFYSVGDIEYSFEDGITRVGGLNKDKISVEDNTYSSNGAGKTTIFNAISQCLFNKSIRGNIPIGATYNTTTKKPYKISVEFLQNGVYYKVINNRAINSILIEENGIDISPKGIKNQLQKIEDILGVDYEVFNILTYLNQKNILAITDIASTDNIVYRFFSLDRLTMLRKKNRNNLRNLKKELADIISHKSSIEKALADNDKFDSADISSLYDRIKEINILIEEIKTSKTANALIDLHKTLEEYSKDLDNNNTKKLVLCTNLDTVGTQYNKLSDGVCPLCGNSVDENALHRLHNDKQKLVTNIDVVNSKIVETKETLKAIENEIDVKKRNIKDTLTTFTAEIDTINKKILVLEEKNRNYAKFRKTREALTKEIEVLTKRQHEASVKLDFIVALDEIIKSGMITRSYIDTFVALFNTKLEDFVSLLDIDLTIYAVSVDGKVEFKVNDKAGEISYTALSSGEQTRVALIILITTLVVLEIIAGISINFIVFDELLSVLDKDGIEMFKTLLNTLKRNKNLFIVLHHNEIEDDFFDRVFTVVKQDGISSIDIVRGNDATSDK